MAEGAPLRLRVFTHPACSGCAAAVERAWRLTRERDGIELTTVSLESPEGLAEARSARVTTIPTVVLSNGGGELERWTGTPDEASLSAALDRPSRAAEGVPSPPGGPA